MSKSRYNRTGPLAVGIIGLCFLAAAGAQQTTTNSGAAPKSSISAVHSQPNPSTVPQIDSRNTGSATAPPSPPVQQFTVLLDPAHGGAENGADLGAAGMEKAYVLALAGRLRLVLNRHGIHTVMTRTADSSVDPVARAEIANRAHASACILLHASGTGTGVHLFTSSLPLSPQSNPRRVFLPWQTAQAAYGTQSLRLESDLNAALAHQHIPVILDKTSLGLLDSMACPAVAIEVAPLNTKTALTDAGYQQRILRSLDAALTAWESDWGAQP